METYLLDTPHSFEQFFLYTLSCVTLLTGRYVRLYIFLFINLVYYCNSVYNDNKSKLQQNMSVFNKIKCFSQQNLCCYNAGSNLQVRPLACHKVMCPLKG